MSTAVSIVVCWNQGTEEMLTACLKSIQRHTRDVEYEVVLVSADQPDGKARIPELSDSISLKRLRYLSVPLEQGENSSHVHGKLLDAVIPSRIDSKYLLTLDSDCFPVADGWLTELIAKLEGGAMLAGILHPGAPPPEDMSQSKLEYRVRSQHCWNITHVACQLIRMADYCTLYENGCRYNAGDDTGLSLPKMVLSAGGKIDGFKVSRGPVVWEGDLDPEYNRYVSLVYGDKVYHHGGFSRKRTGDDEKTFATSFAWCEDMVLWGHGAEFLLNDRFSYQFKFDKEELVAKEKMQRLFGLVDQRMRG